MSYDKLWLTESIANLLAANPWLRLDEVADALKVSRRTVHNIQATEGKTFIRYRDDMAHRALVRSFHHQPTCSIDEIIITIRLSVAPSR